MLALFSPAVALMNRLRYKSKFMLLGAVVSVVIAVLLFSIYGSMSRDIAMADNELAGLQMLKPANRLVQVMQQHRGLSSGVLNGNEAMKEKRTAKEKEVVDAFAAAEATLSPKLREAPNWKAVRQDWEAIRTQGLTWAPAENLKRHTAMIASALQFMIDIADETELSLDPVMDTYYFMDTIVSKMPAMLEPLGITRARGTGVLSKKDLPAQMRVDLVSLIAEMSSTLKAQNNNLAKVISFAPSLQGALAAPGKEFADGVEKIFALVRDDILTEKYATPPQDYFNATTQVIDLGYKVMFDTLIPQFEQRLQLRRDTARQMLIMNIALAILVVLLVCYLGIGAYYSVLNSVSNFSQGAHRLAAGDLTAEFETQGADELHAAGKDFNGMAVAFRKLLGTIKRDIGELTLAAEHLSASSHQISSGAASQSDAASSMAAAIEQMTVGVDHIAKNAQDAQHYSRESDEVAAHGGRIVQAVVTEIQGIAATVNQSAVAVESLGQQSEQISAIVGTIKDIADQTNLLALNAAIEAARAGEAGRGFSVVADEVRSLASRTQQSTREIREMIGKLQDGAGKAAAVMHASRELARQTVEQTSQAENALARIRQEVSAINSMNAQIASASEQQSQAAEEVSQNISRIHLATRQTAVGSEQVAAASREHDQQVEQLNEAVARATVERQFMDLEARYSDLAEVPVFLDEVKRDIIEKGLEIFGAAPAEKLLDRQRLTPFNRYFVNVLVDNGDCPGAPLVYEDYPSYQNLVGRIEHQAQMGTLHTDFTLIKSGALHRANGGYLLLDARKLLTQPFAWEALKRALQARELRLQSLEQILSLASTISLEPDPIPLDVKVVLIGDRLLYYLLTQYDPEFPLLFKVEADFAEDIARSADNTRLYAQLIATLQRRERLRPLDAAAVARLVEQAARHADDGEKLSLHMQSLLDLMREADYWAGEEQRPQVCRDDVERAVRERLHRADQIRERLLEATLRDLRHIETDGRCVAQINGLAVLQLGSHAFGHPARISATARLGDGKLIDIEREVELGGALHSKGVLILSAYVASRFGGRAPLSFSASLVFEQSYAGVDGDSASCAELCVLQSALGELPLRQDLAITGSVDQHGRMQVIGGVNEKIEGFFDLCAARGLSGSQGVIIPQGNVKHLMLRREVVEAVAAGRFHVHAVAHAEQAMELLSGLPAGGADASGQFPPGTVNGAVQRRLRELSELRQRYAHPEGPAGNGQAST